MTNIEHAIENAITAMSKGKTLEEWLKCQDKWTLDQIKATPEEIWAISDYVLNNYTIDYYCRLSDKYKDLPNEIVFYGDLAK